MVSGLIHSLADGAIIVAGSVIVVTLVHFLCVYNYFRGRAEGMRDEAFAWCAAFDEIRPPNWQNFPLGRTDTKDEDAKLAEEEANKLYAHVFHLAKEAIGQELANNRLEALKKEFIKMGMVIPPLPENFGDGIQGS
jgi:hypothetical protein